MIPRGSVRLDSWLCCYESRATFGTSGHRAALAYPAAGEAGQLETLQRHHGLRVADHTAQQFAQQWAEFETMTGETGGKKDARVCWQAVKNEILVRGHIVHARVDVCQFCPA